MPETFQGLARQGQALDVSWLYSVGPEALAVQTPLPESQIL